MQDLTLTDQIAEMDIDGPDYDGPKSKVWTRNSVISNVVV